MTWDHISGRLTLDATVTSDHISATAVYLMWREHFWNASVHLSSLVLGVLVILENLSVIYVCMLSAT